jgi:hypothetical protein
MTEKYTLNTQELESINSELFSSFDPEQELWIIGGSTKQSFSTGATYNGGHPDFGADYDITW